MANPTKDGKHKLILISLENYWHLKNLGKAGDTFDQVITQLLKDKKHG